MYRLRTVLVSWLALTMFAGATYAATPVQTERIQLDPDGAARADKTLPITPGDDPFSAPEFAPGGDNDIAAEAPQTPIPPVLYGEAGLPKPVARMRAQLLDAAHAGDFERLRMVLEGNEMLPTLTFGEMTDPIDTLKAQSGDPDGYEILAILIEVLEAGYVHADQGTAQEMYIWPYFARTPLDRLTSEQKVELFQLVTAGDMIDMDVTGTWTFYRVGIGPDGTLHYFVAGD